LDERPFSFAFKQECEQVLGAAITGFPRAASWPQLRQEAIYTAKGIVTTSK
jgi:hypothetical protein